MAAPLPEKSNATISISRMIIILTNMLFSPLLVNRRSIERAAYEHAMAFDATKYLVQRSKEMLIPKITEFPKYV